MRRFKNSPKGICIHHSLTADGYVKQDTDAIRRYHVETNGWDEIGYHYLVERIDGVPQVTTGRPAEYQGAHCPALNATHFGICIVGNYDLAPPDRDMLDTLRDLCNHLMEGHRILYRDIAYHCDYSHKSCPGNLFPKTGFLLDLAGEVRP